MARGLVGAVAVVGPDGSVLSVAGATGVLYRTKLGATQIVDVLDEAGALVAGGLLTATADNLMPLVRPELGGAQGCFVAFNGGPRQWVVSHDLSESVKVAAAEAVAGDPTLVDAAVDRVVALTAGDLGLAHVVIGKNLYNPGDADVMPGYGINFGGSYGAPLASAAYTLTGFIPVTAGAQYTLSNPRSLCFYTAAKAAIAASGVDVPSQVATTATVPASAAYVRASFHTANFGPSFQVEAGGSATAYEAFTASVPGLTVNATAAAAKASADVSAAKLAGYAVSANLFDPSVALMDTLLSGGGTTAFAGYVTSPHIPAIAGRQYTTRGRHLWFFNSAGTLISSGGTSDNPGLGVITGTAPAGTATMRVDTTTATMGGLMLVEGATYPGAYIAPGVTITGLQAPITGPVAMARGGTSVTITGTLGAALLSVATKLDGSSNGALTINATTRDGTTVHSVAAGDEVTPIRTQMGTVGANHGYTCVTTLSNPDGKTAADLGARYSDGSREYVILAVTAGLVTVGGSYVTDGAGVTTSANAQPTTDLTWVAGGTNTGTMAASSKAAVGAVQLYPSIARRTVTVAVDGQPATANGTVRGREVAIRESYEILDYASLYDTAKANVGVAYSTLPVAGAVRVENTFRYSAGGRCRVSTTLTELKPTTLGVCGLVQSVALTPGGGQTLVRYLPGVAAIGGRAWASGVDMTSYSANDIVTTGTLLASQPPCFSLDRIHASGVTQFGFALGYLPFGARASDASTNAARLAAAPTNLWDLRSTKKSYPTVWTSKAAGWGRLTIEAFRVYLTAGQVDAVVSAGPDALAAWAALDAQAGLS